MISTDNNRALLLHFPPLSSATDAGKLLTFGETEFGKLGFDPDSGADDDDVIDNTTPHPVAGMPEKMKGVACGGSHTLALAGEKWQRNGGG